MSRNDLDELIADLRKASNAWFPQDLILKLETIISLAQKGFIDANSIPAPK